MQAQFELTEGLTRLEITMGLVEGNDGIKMAASSGYVRSKPTISARLPRPRAPAAEFGDALAVSLLAEENHANELRLDRIRAARIKAMKAQLRRTWQLHRYP